MVEKMEEIYYGEFIKDRRIKLGLSQQALANVLQCSYQAISKYERDLVRLDISLLSKLASVLELDVESFILKKEEKLNDYASKFSFDYQKFTTRLVYLREKREIPQKVAAKSIGIKASRLSKLENGQAVIKIEEFIALANYYEVSLTSFYYAMSDEELFETFNPAPVEQVNEVNKDNKEKPNKFIELIKKPKLYIPLALGVVAVLILSISLPLSLQNSSYDYSDFEFSKDKRGYILTSYTGLDDTSVFIPGEYKGEKVYKIGEKAFNNLTNITSIEVGEGVEEIASGAFLRCYSLKKISLPSTLNSLEGNAFFIAYSLNEIDLDENNEYFDIIDGNLYSEDHKVLYKVLPNIGNNGRSFDIPEGVETLKSGSFDSNYHLADISFPSSLKKIEKQAFIDCYNIQELVFNEGLEEIDVAAISGVHDNITNIVLPSTIKGFENGNPFIDLPTLNSVSFRGENPNFKIIDGCFYSNDGSILYYVPQCYPNDVLTIPEETRVISKYAISSVRRLLNIIIPSTVERLNSYAIFSNKGLDSVCIKEGDQILDQYSIYKCNNATIYIEADTLSNGFDQNFTDSDYVLGATL